MSQKKSFSFKMNLLVTDSQIETALAEKSGLIIIVGTVDSKLAATLIAIGSHHAQVRAVYGVFGRYEENAGDCYDHIPFNHEFHSALGERLANFIPVPGNIILVEQIVDRLTAQNILRLAQTHLVVAGVSGLDVFSASDRYTDFGFRIEDLIGKLRLVISHQLKTDTYQILDVGERQRALMRSGHYTQFHKLELGVREIPAE